MNWRHSRATAPNPATTSAPPVALALETGAFFCQNAQSTQVPSSCPLSAQPPLTGAVLGRTQPQHSIANLRISGSNGDGRESSNIYAVRTTDFLQSASPSVVKVNVPRQAILCRVVEPKSSATVSALGYYSAVSPFTSVVCTSEDSNDSSQLQLQPQPRPNAFLIHNLSCERPTFSASCDSSALSATAVVAHRPNQLSSTAVSPSLPHPYSDFVLPKPYPQQHQRNNLLFMEQISPPPTPSSGAQLAKPNESQSYSDAEYPRLAQGTPSSRRSSASSSNMGNDLRCSAPSHSPGVDSKAQLLIPLQQNKSRTELRSITDTRRRSQESLLSAQALPMKLGVSAIMVKSTGVGVSAHSNSYSGGNDSVGGGSSINSSSGSSNPTSVSSSAETSKSSAEHTITTAPLATALSADATSLDEATMEMSSKCDHVTYWKRLRSKRGYAHYLCTLCEARWQVPTQLSKSFLRSLNSKNSSVNPPAIPSEPSTPPRLEPTPAVFTPLLTTSTTAAALSPASLSPSPTTDLITVNPALNITPVSQKQQLQQQLNPHSDSHFFRSQSTSSQLTAVEGGVGSSVGCASTELTPASWGFMAGKSMSTLSIGCSSSASSSFTCGTCSCSSSIPRTVIPSRAMPGVEAVGVERSPVLTAAVADFTPYSPFTCPGFSLFLPSPAGGMKDELKQ